MAQHTQKYSGPSWQTSELHLCLSTAAIETYSELYQLVFSTEYLWNLDTEFPLGPEKNTLKMLENQPACKRGYLGEVTPTRGIF